MDATSPKSTTSRAGLVAYVSHPPHGGSSRSEERLDLYPNSAVSVVEESRPDAVVIDASAALAGSPWAGAGSEVDPTRTWELVELIRTAHGAGIATVFRWDVPAHRVPVLRRIASRCQVVVTAEPGTVGEGLSVLPHSDHIDEARRIGVLVGVTRLAELGSHE